MALRRRTWIAALAGCFLLGAGSHAVLDRQPEDFSDEWRLLWGRCREAIEKVGPLNTVGLSPLDLPRTLQSELVGRAARWRLLGSSGSRLAILEKEDGKPYAVRRDCRVIPSPGAPPFTRRQKAYLAHAFMIEQSDLIGAGTHVARPLLRLFPLILLSSQFIVKNKNNCSTILTMTFDTNNSQNFDQNAYNFSSAVGEQVFEPCAGKSFLELVESEHL